MTRVGIQDLRARLLHFLDRVAAGETVILTRRGKPVARIVPEPKEPR